MTVPAFTPITAERLVLRRWRDPAFDLDHPNLAPGDPLRPHVLYRGRRP